MKKTSLTHLKRNRDVQNKHDYFPTIIIDKYHGEEDGKYTEI